MTDYVFPSPDEDEFLRVVGGLLGGSLLGRDITASDLDRAMQRPIETINDMNTKLTKEERYLKWRLGGGGRF